MATYVVSSFPQPFIMNETGTDAFAFGSRLVDETLTPPPPPIIVQVTNGLFVLPSIMLMIVAAGALPW